MTEDGQRGRPFADASVSFAVDVSGSTYGRTILCEKTFVRRVSSLLSGPSQAAATVLPWHGWLEPVGSLSTLDKLASLYGTKPRVMLQDSGGQEALKGSDLWFLMTDGLVRGPERVAFADCIANAGLHGTSCITVIFGSLAIGPGSCNISVGVSVFAMCPNCLFLFYDTGTEEIIVMQTKGIFNTLLKGSENPVFDEASKWDSFPRLCLDDLSNIIIPPPTRLGKDEVQLLDSLVINFEDLWANKLSKDEVESVLANEDSLRTVIMSAQSSGNAAKFQKWVRQQQTPIDDSLEMTRIDTGGQAQSAFLAVLEARKEGRQDGMAELQRNLRAAHESNMQNFLKTCQTNHELSLQRQDIIDSACRQSRQEITSAVSLNRTSHYSMDCLTSAKRVSPPGPLGGLEPKKARRDPGPWSSSGTSPSWDQVSQTSGSQSWVDLEDNDSRSSTQPQQLDDPAIPAGTPQTTPQDPNTVHRNVRYADEDEITLKWVEIQAKQQGLQLAQLAPWQTAPFSWKNPTPNPSLRTLLWTPGFRRGENDIGGTCSFCGGSDMPLALLFRRPSAEQLPRTGIISLGEKETIERPSHPSHLAEHSLEVGNTRCCEACSTYWVTSQPPQNGKIASSFPVVKCHDNLTVYPNRTTYLNRCRELFDERLDSKSAIGFLLNALLTAHGKPETEVSNIKDVLRWMCADLCNWVALETNAITKGSGQPVALPASEVNQVFANANSSASSLVQYPLSQFITVLQVASVLNIPDEVRCTVAFRRYLLHLTERFDAMAKENPRAKAWLADLLWQQTYNDPDLIIVDSASKGENGDAGEGSRRAPVLALPVSKLKGSDLLSDDDYAFMQMAEEFRLLDEPSNPWVGCVTVLFLHALVDVFEKHVYESAVELFNLVMTRKQLASVFTKPSAVDVNEVASMLKSLQI